MNNKFDGQSLFLVVAMIFAINMAPWFLAPFGQSLVDPAGAATEILGRLVLLAVLAGLFVFVRRFGIVPVLLFFLNPLAAFGYVKARGWVRGKVGEAKNEAARYDQRRAPQSALDTLWSQPKKTVPTPAKLSTMPEEAARTAPKASPSSAPSPFKEPTRTRPAPMQVTDLGPRKKDRFADSPISSRRRGLFG
ncbi:MAG: hypothetical protein AAGI10_12590 [Pseudomonadota bacterium]